MDERKARRMAAHILKVGETKIWISPEQKGRLKESMTKDDVRALIKDRVIAKRKDALHSRGGARILQGKKRKGRKRGQGKRLGTRNARMNKKERWTNSMRAQRKVLKELKRSGAKFKVSARQVYRLIKGNFFRGKNNIKQYVEADKK